MYIIIYDKTAVMPIRDWHFCLHCDEMYDKNVEKYVDCCQKCYTKLYNTKKKSKRKNILQVAYLSWKVEEDSPV